MPANGERPLVAICGVGALGSTAVLFARNLDARLRLIDFDRVESKNLQAQWFVKQSIGKNKADAMRLQLANFYGVKAESRGVRLVDNNAAELLAGCAIAVDAFDNHDSRELLSRAAAAAGVPVVHAAMAGDGTFGLVRWDPHFEPDREDTEGQATCEGGEHLPVIGLIGATVARALSEHLEHGRSSDYMISLSGVSRTR